MNDFERKLSLLAMFQPAFADVYDFLKKARDSTSRDEFILMCRAKFPDISRSLEDVTGKNAVTIGLKNVACMNDEEIMNIANTLIDTIKKTVDKTDF